MGSNSTASGRRSYSRRDVLTATGVAGASGLTGCLSAVAGGTTTTRTPDPVTVGLNTALSGTYAYYGESELEGAELAIEHLNEGGGLVDGDVFASLSGDGVLGREVELAQGNTAGETTSARDSARGLIDDGADVLVGGAAGSAVLAQRHVAGEEEVIYLCGFSHLNKVTGEGCNRYTFREMFNSRMSVDALIPSMLTEFGEGTSFYQLYADNDWGWGQTRSVESRFSEAGWSPVGATGVALGLSEYDKFVERLKIARPDVLFLNLVGFDAVHAVREIQAAYGDELDGICVPLYDRLLASTAGDAIEGVVGTSAWTGVPASETARTFTRSYRETHGENTWPSAPAHVVYTQILQYAAAVERAGTVESDAVVDAMADTTYDVGLGHQRMRPCDHQATRPVLVVEGRSSDDRTDRTPVTHRSTATPIYACDAGPAANCSL